MKKIFNYLNLFYRYNVLLAKYKYAKRKIKLLEKKIEKLWNREKEYVSCPIQQFKRCEHVKIIKSNEALAKVFLSASNMLNDNGSFKQLESKSND